MHPCIVTPPPPALHRHCCHACVQWCLDVTVLTLIRFYICIHVLHDGIACGIGAAVVTRHNTRLLVVTQEPGRHFDAWFGGFTVTVTLLESCVTVGSLLRSCLTAACNVLHGESDRGLTLPRTAPKNKNKIRKNLRKPARRISLAALLATQALLLDQRAGHNPRAKQPSNVLCPS